MVWLRNKKTGGLFNTDDVSKKEYNKGVFKEVQRKDLIEEVYKGGDGYWNIELKNGYESPEGNSYIWAKTKKEAYEILDSVIYDVNKKREK